MQRGVSVVAVLTWSGGKSRSLVIALHANQKSTGSRDIYHQIVLKSVLIAKVCAVHVWRSSTSIPAGLLPAFAHG